MPHLMDMPGVVAARRASRKGDRYDRPISHGAPLVRNEDPAMKPAKSTSVILAALMAAMIAGIPGPHHLARWRHRQIGIGR
jgi:hypothetical protein